MAAFLLDLCPPEATRCEVTLPCDKALIAARSGMQPESLSRAFARLQRHGVFLTRHAVGIDDLGTLHRLIDEAQAGRSDPDDARRRTARGAGEARQSSGTR